MIEGGWPEVETCSPFISGCAGETLSLSSVDISIRGIE
jgi:hypothetical protein